MAALEGILVPLYDASGECRWLNGPPDAIGEWSVIEDFDDDNDFNSTPVFARTAAGGFWGASSSGIDSPTTSTPVVDREERKGWLVSQKLSLRKSPSCSFRNSFARDDQLLPLPGTKSMPDVHCPRGKVAEQRTPGRQDSLH